MSKNSAAQTIRALAQVVEALAPLDPEQRRRALEAAHSLLEIGRGAVGQDKPARPSKKKGRR